MLPLRGDCHAQQMRFGVLAVDAHHIVVAGEAIEQGDAIDEHIRTFILLHKHRRHAGGVGIAFLHVVVVEGGASFCHNFHHLAREVGVGGFLGVVASEQFGLCPFIEHHQEASECHQGHRSIENVDQLYGFFHHHALGHINEDAVLRQQGVERHFGLLHIRHLSQVLAQDGGVPLLRLRKTFNHQSLGGVALGGARGCKYVIKKEIQASAQIGHIAAE